jgi:hypothetical protein
LPILVLEVVLEVLVFDRLSAKPYEGRQICDSLQNCIDFVFSGHASCIKRFQMLPYELPFLRVLGCREKAAGYFSKESVKLNAVLQLCFPIRLSVLG